MKTDNLLTITITIQGIVIPFEINREDEEIYRKASDLVNKNIQKYNTHFRQLDSMSILTMVAFELAVMLQSQLHKEDYSPLESKMKELLEKVNSTLEKP